MILIFFLLKLPPNAGNSISEPSKIKRFMKEHGPTSSPPPQKKVLGPSVFRNYSLAGPQSEISSYSCGLLIAVPLPCRHYKNADLECKNRNNG